MNIKYILTTFGVAALVTAAYFFFSVTIQPLPIPPPLTALPGIITNADLTSGTPHKNLEQEVVTQPATPIPTAVTQKKTMKQAIDGCFGDADFEKCLAGFIEPYISANGTLAALKEINTLQQSDSRIRSSCHPIVHVIGRETFQQQGDIPKSFAACDQTCHSGCYHGAMERFLRGESVYSDPAEERSHISETEVKQKIQMACQNDQQANLRFQCLHGLGHAVVFFLGYDLVKSLQYCDILSSPWDRQSCWGGAIMENITAADKSKRYLSATDYHFPCTALDDKYKNDCYVMQTSRMLEMGLSWDGIAAECKKAGLYRIACMQSMGRDASNNSRVEKPEAAARICEKTEGSDREACVRGVAYALADNTWDGTYVMPFCDSFLNVSDQSYCFRMTRNYMMGSLVRTEAFVDQNCKTFVPNSDLCLTK